MSIAQNYPTIKPSLNLDFANVKQLDPRITFTRASTATYYDGVTVAKAEENLWLYSQEFDNAYWGKSAASITANTTAAPDGTTTADTLTADGTSATHTLDRSFTVENVQRTYSVFAKAGTNDFLQIRLGADASIYANFNLATGALGTVAGGTATITASTNGFYRCTLTFTSATATGVSLNIITSATAARNESNTLSTSIFLWGAQIEQRSAVTAYTPTTTQPITNYIPVLQSAASGVARFDHNPVTGESLGLLIEEQRTNLLRRSAEFDNAAWVKIRASATANVAIAPDGTLTGDKLVEDTTASSLHFIYQYYAATSTVLTLTVYAKAGERNSVKLEISNFLNDSAKATINLLTGVITGVSSGSIDYTNVSATATAVGNGWYRCSLTATKGTANSTNQSIIITHNGTTESYTGDGYSGIYIWGAQLEAGAFPTSYIPTVAAQVTRSADAASMTGTNFSSWYRADEGTLYAEATTFATTGFKRVASIGDNSVQNNCIQLLFGAASGNMVSSIRVNDVVQAAFNGGSLSNKTALAYKFNNANNAYNGVLSVGDTSCTIPTVDRIGIGNTPNLTENLNGTIKKLAYYPQRLTNDNLQALTS